MIIPVYIITILWLLLMAIGQILFKFAANKIDLTEKGLVDNFLLNPFLLFAVILYFLATLLWVWILSHMPLKQAYPLNAFGFIIVPILASFIFKEVLTFHYWVGVIFIIAGVLIVNTGS